MTRTVILSQLALFAVIHATKLQHVREAATAEETAKKAAEKAEEYHEKAEAAAKHLMESAAEARKNAHGDGSDRFVNHLEESMLDLMEMDHENKEKAKARHARHEKERQALHAKFEKEQQELHARFEKEKAERKKAHDQLEKEMGELKAKMNVRHEAARQELHAEHRRQDADHVRQWKASLKSPANDDKATADGKAVIQSGHSGLFLCLFLVIGVIVGLALLWKSGVNVSVQIPGLGRVNPVKWMDSIFSSKGGVDNSYIFLDREDKRASAPLRPATAAGNYGGLAL